ncbi:MAG: Xaa-Pro aminopeptidase [Myxococcota bacterium]
MYGKRREKFLEQIGAGVAVFPSAPVAIRNNDVEHEYRQDSDLFYLTGFDEPESVLVLTNAHKEHRSVLFVRKRDPNREVWDGPRAGVEGALADFGVDAAYPIHELAEKLPDYLSDVHRLHYRLGVNRGFDDQLLRAIDAVRRKARTGVRPPGEIVDPGLVLHEMRLRKETGELDAMRRAAAITGEAHQRAMEVARPGVFEYQVEAEILHSFRANGAERPAYGSIVGSGRNATVLHYRKNDRQLEDGDLLLIDAGCEYGYYAADVTRTFPVNGAFSDPQRELYDLVLASQKAAVSAVKPGATLDDVHQVAVRVLTEGMIQLGLIEGPFEKAIEEELYKPYYMHRTSHWLGMDVHDVGPYFVDGNARPLEEGFVLTVEPGIYVSETAEVDPRYQGIGIRIEDDVLVTGDGNENLTAHIPKEPGQVEELLASRTV